MISVHTSAVLLATTGLAILLGTGACTAATSEDGTGSSEQGVTGLGSGSGTGTSSGPSPHSPFRRGPKGWERKPTPPCTEEDAAYDAALDAFLKCSDKPDADCHCEIQKVQIELWNRAYCLSNSENPDGSPKRISCVEDIPEVKPDGSKQFTCDGTCGGCCHARTGSGSGSGIGSGSGSHTP